ncbi:reverse transcriptase [Phytophthora megakarya]|uniref:Reverse transcriptase n=1 Tax=Phytophthora megakarya TaxID=4795 RepID=A0A225W931_9STRA|nr:reverse transcriptase [Phytophthora megakarya]
MTSKAEKLRQLFAGSATESEDTASAKTKKERFEEQSWDSLKSSLYYEILREHRDVIIDSMSKSTIHSALDLRDGFYQILMRRKDAPAAFNRCVTHLLRSGRDRVVYYPSRQLKQAGRNYPVDDKELLAMKYALAMFRVYLLGNTPFVVYTDHASLRTAVKSPHMSQQMARWLSFFAEYNFRYKWVRKYVRTCDVCQRVKPAAHLQAPLQPLPTPSECWESISMDFVFGLPRDSRQKTGIVVFVDRISKMVHLAAVAAEVTPVQTARLFVEMVFKHNGTPNGFVSDPDYPQMDGQTERVNRVLVDLLKNYFQSFHNWNDYMPMAAIAIKNAVHASTGHAPFFVNAIRHPRLPRTLGAVASSLSGGESTVASKQPQKTAETDISAATTRARARARTRQGDVSAPVTDTGRNYKQATPVSVRDTETAKTHAQAGPVTRTSDVSMPSIDPEKIHALAGPVANTHEVSVPGTDTQKSHAQSGTDATTNGESVQTTDADKTNEPDPGFSSQAMDFVQERQAVVRFVQDAIAASADRQKLNTDNVGRGNTTEFKIGSLVLLATQNLPAHAVSGFGASKLAPRFIGPFMATKRHGNAYTLELPSDMRLHPTFYVGRLKPYVQPESSSRDDSPTTTRGATSASPKAASLHLEKANLFRHLNTHV